VDDLCKTGNYNELILTVSHNLLHESYQVKDLEDLLVVLQLRPLDDVLNTHRCVFVTSQLPVHLHEFQETTALGVKCYDVVVCSPVLWFGHAWHIRLIHFRLSGSRL